MFTWIKSLRVSSGHSPLNFMKSLTNVGVLEGAIMNCVVTVQFPSFLPFLGDLSARTNFKYNMCIFPPYILKVHSGLFYLGFICELFFREKLHNLLHKT